ncbi:hypothetical protein [Nocardiopsis sp. CNS-639]|uniref:hypothetical protein n=1 Tax=Nocardiopsis sp. CNS-639 TaxID=1169153 RepID=UPI00037381DF|nr:hypothetical protein [Nocardiopsis sp. CNS-639]
MSEALSPEQMSTAVLDVATARSVLDEATARSEAARRHARTCLLPYVRAGVKSLTATLPDGTTLGTLSFVRPAPRIRWDKAAITEFVDQTAPTEIDEDIDPGVLANPDVVQWLIEHHPEAVIRTVRPKYLTVLEQDLDEKGRLRNPDTGELVPVATVTIPKSTGQFQWTPDQTQQPRLLAAVRAGELGDDADLLKLLPEPHVDEAGTDGVSADEPEEDPMVEPWHLAQLHTRMREAGLSDRDEALAYISQVLGITVNSRKNLRLSQWEHILGALEQVHASAI